VLPSREVPADRRLRARERGVQVHEVLGEGTRSRLSVPVFGNDPLDKRARDVKQDVL